MRAFLVATFFSLLPLLRTDELGHLDTNVPFFFQFHGRNLQWPVYVEERQSRQEHRSNNVYGDEYAIAAFFGSFASSNSSNLNSSNLSNNCSSVLGLFGKKLADPRVLGIIDSFGKPKAGIMQGALAWPGNFDECIAAKLPIDNVTYAMRHCMMPLNTSFTKGMPYAASYMPGASGGMLPSWGLCLPRECNDDDVLILANMLLDGVKLPLSLVMSFVKNASMLPGTCRSEDDPPPAVDGGIVFFFLLLGAIGSLTVVGTIFDYVVLDLRIGAVDHISDWIKFGDGIEDDGGEKGAHVQVKKEDGTKNRHPLVKFLLCFSMLTNGRKLLSLAPPTDNIGCINGIRFLSLTWVILGHTFGFVPSTLSNALYTFVTIPKRVSFQPIGNGTYSVDSFFVLSGFLTAYLFFKRNGDKKESPTRIIKTVCSMYLHRYLRLTPALAILMGFAMTLPLYLTNGPNAATAAQLTGTCDKYWWYNILYINNFDLETGKCVGHVWYLANDMQFFLLSPIFLYAFKRHEIFGYVTTTIFWLASTAATIGISDYYDSGILIMDLTANMDKIYIKPWCRIGPYLIGIVAGYLLYKFRREDKKMNPIVAAVMWAISAAIALAVIYGLADYYVDGTKPTKEADVIYLSLSRSAWGIAVAWVTFACAVGSGGPVNTLLSWTPFGPVSRINYSAYLYHILVMTIVMQNLKSYMLYSDYLFVTFYLGFLVLSYGVAFLASLWFESPFIALEKLVF